MVSIACILSLHYSLLSRRSSLSLFLLNNCSLFSFLSFCLLHAFAVQVQYFPPVLTFLKNKAHPSLPYPCPFPLRAPEHHFGSKIISAMC
ncbi:hypothetical protein BCR41DRAFT_354665 [Lobosporangium transversale]|uniref:Uncharacterized protein n=1 Tax=Lobosporangium transversale TaxID=64571 RepID=A0A1Y2GL79_9FUNG|nr:hypothetical protein BCR41DRAFT_354665 [Lobosporangium transversale]ORZ14319.1 hypothetical protein BCR41DRAFT_354665 [Lobosporangium transversale]|eukprot:XP_021880797.1 hypothetical protein BCR41DRAFT_354665 [Lobosporangium transversale]